MDFLSKTRHSAAEMVLILATSLALIGEGSFNLTLLAILAVLLMLWISQNKVLGLLIASLLAISAIWLSGAVINEYESFPSRTSRESVELLITGIAVFCTLGFLSLLMFRKYSPLRS